jgi:hypothetical protein
MSNNLHNNGEAQILEDATGSTQYELGLYHDATDLLSDDSTLADITTEPDNAEDYSRQTVSGLNVSMSGGDAQAVAPEVIFNVSSNTETVDAVFVVNTSTDELQFTSDLEDGERDLAPADRLVNNDTGLTLD